ncbi:hypothetical protein HK405_004522 [Cladochytrium tenue]|nr:hypothetical protein HK405_004522 [Cladochytrium tenue]
MASPPLANKSSNAAAAAGPAAAGAKTVAVLGAGVQGLTAALLLRLQGHAVTVVARGSPDDLATHAPPDRAAAKAAGSTPVDPTFTSPKAGANWQSFADKDDVRQQRWDEATFYTLHRLGYHAPSGVMHLPAFQYFAEPPAGFEDPWFARIVPGYGPVPADQLPPGCRYRLRHRDAECTEIPVLVSCAVPPARSLEVDPQTAQGIMERCVAVCPELVVNGKLPEVVQHSVGLRPARKGGVRMEANYESEIPEFLDHVLLLKQLTSPSVLAVPPLMLLGAEFNGREVLVVHNYGHGGFGFQSSWGCASNVVGIVRRALGQPADDKILTDLLNEIFASKL